MKAYKNDNDFENRLNCSVTVSLAPESAVTLESASVKPLPRLMGLVFLVSLSCIAISVASTQSPTPTPTPTATASPTPTPSPTPPPPPPLLPDGSPTATIGFPDSTFLYVPSDTGLFPQVATQIGQSLGVQVRFPLEFAGANLIAQSLDGGTFPNGQDSLTVAADGTVSIQFQTGNQPGVYRLLLIVNETGAMVQFFVPSQ